MDLLLSSPPFWIAVGIVLVLGFLLGRATGPNAS